MPDFATNMPVTPYNPMGGLQTLQGVLGIQAKQLDIQKGQQDLLTAQANAQQAQQSMQERMSFRDRVLSGKDEAGNSLYQTDSSGNPALDPITKRPLLDTNKVTSMAQRTMPLTGNHVSQKFIKTDSDRIGLDKSVQELQGNYRADIAGIIRSHQNDPKVTAAQIQRELDEYAEAHGGASNPQVLAAVHYAGGMIGDHFDDIPKTPGANNAPSMRTQLLTGIAARLQPPATTAAQAQPNVALVQGPQGLTPTETNPNAPGGAGAQVGPPVRQGVAPQVTQTPQGNVGVISPSGTIRPASVAPSGVGPAPADAGGYAPAGGSQPGMPGRLQAIPRPGLNAPAVDQQRYNKLISDSGQHVQDVSAAANDTQNGVGATRYRNGQILDLVARGKNPMTGPGMEHFNYIASKLPGDSGDAYQKIGHYLAQNSAAIAKTMGVPNTNLGAETAAAGAGNVSQNPGAIREITKVNDALNSALDAYNRGLARVSNNGADPSKVPAYRQAFGQNFDVNVYRYDDALRRGDQDEINRLTKQLGPKGMQALGQKRKIMHSLAETGDLP